MITYGFFDSVAGDRKYSAEDIGFYLHGLITSGVYEDAADSLQVLAGTGMQVEVRPGRAMLEYHWLKNDEPMTLQLSAGGSLPRIDIVVARLDLDARLCEIVVKEGTPSQTPTRPIMLRSDFVKEYILAEIYVNRLSTAISQSNITDKRADDTVCGWVRAMIRDGAGVPAPAASDVGKALVAKANGAGYELKSMVQKSGDTMTGPLDMNGNKITTLGPPVYGSDAATADYVKNQIKTDVTNKKGAAGGIASLDDNGKVPSSQLPAMDYIATSQKGAVNGVAALDADGHIPASYIKETTMYPTGVEYIFGRAEKNDTVKIRVWGKLAIFSGVVYIRPTSSTKIIGVKVTTGFQPYGIAPGAYFTISRYQDGAGGGTRIGVYSKTVVHSTGITFEFTLPDGGNFETNCQYEFSCDALGYLP